MLMRQFTRLVQQSNNLGGTSAGCTRWFSNNKQQQQQQLQQQQEKQPQQFIKVEQDSELEEVAIVTLNKEPVNSLCIEKLRQLDSTFEYLARESNYKAAILTSSSPGQFCAGLDLLSMCGGTYNELYELWSTFQKAWITLYGTPLITVAAVNGNAPGGGCQLAMSCDHRVMAEGKYRIGLNATQVGIVASFWMRNTMQHIIGFREADKALQAGTRFRPEKAKEIGLVDAVVPMDQVIPASRDFIREYLKLPYEPRYMTKQMNRQPNINKLKFKLHEDAAFMATWMTRDAFQKNLEKYVEALGQKDEKCPIRMTTTG